MPNDYSDDQLRLAARLYYIDGLGQVEVAKLVKVSQAQVSRLLALARQRGIVRISVAEYEPHALHLEARLKKELGLQSVAVIKTIPNANPEEVRMAVAHFGAPLVASQILPKSTVAISGGRTMRELVQLFPEDKHLRVTVVQAMGSIDSNVSAVDAFELGRVLARLWGGSFITLSTPAFVPDQKSRNALLKLPQIREVLSSLNHANVALVGIGTLENSVFVERGVLSSQELKKLSNSGAVGEICGRIYDQNGRQCNSSLRDRVISIDLDQLQKIPQVIGIVAGADRAQAVKAAVRGGLVKSLVIDDNLAAALLDSNPERRDSKTSNDLKK